MRISDQLLAIGSTLCPRMAVAWLFHSPFVGEKDSPFRLSTLIKTSSISSRTPPLDHRHSFSSPALAHGEEDASEWRQDEHQVADLAKIIA